MPRLFYSNIEGSRKIAHVSAALTDDFYFSPDGKDFYRCLEKERHGYYRNSFDLSFQINRHPKLGTVRMKRGDLSVKDYTKQGKVSQKEITLTYGNGISEKFVHDPKLDDTLVSGEIYEFDEREPEYLCKLRDGNFILVDKKSVQNTYDSMRCWLGDGKIMKEIKIKPWSFERYRDGGTTVFSTKDHSFFWPTPYEPENKPTWDKEEIIPCLDKYGVVYNENMVPTIIEK